jgi:hypothetical protein
MTVFSVLQKDMEVSAETRELFIWGVCVLHDFIIKEIRNINETLLKRAAWAMTEDHIVTCYATEDAVQIINSLYLQSQSHVTTSTYNAITSLH